MSLARSADEILDRYVELETECIDRLYLNLYVPMLQTERGVAFYWIHHRGYGFASSGLIQPMTESFIRSIERFAEDENIDIINFKRGQRKEEIAKKYLAEFPEKEGVLFIGKAQEKARTVRTERRRNPKTGKPYAWLVSRITFVNYYYFYCVDRDFGPFFIKLCSYFPYNGKVCLNGHEYAKRQLQKNGIRFEALENGVRACEDPKRLQRICDGLTEKKIDALVRKWFRRLPHPYPAKDRRAGFRYEISILQAEFALTQVLDRPMTGRLLFDSLIRENLDLGRPDQVQLIFDRRVQRNTPGRFRTRVLTQGVIPSLYVDYKNSRIKQYHKEGRALRTETTINDTYDFAIGRRLQNLPELREVGFDANRRLLAVQRISHDAAMGENAFQQLNQSIVVDGQRAPALRFGDQRVMALLAIIVIFRLLPRGFQNRDLRQHLATLLGLEPDQITLGKMTYDLRRLRLHGLIERIPKTHRYRVTDSGFRTALFINRAHARLLRPGLATALSQAPPGSNSLRKALANVDKVIDQTWREQKLAA